MPTGSFDINELKRRMQGATQSLKHELGGLRTGRAAASMLEPVQVDAYGTHMPLNQLATIRCRYGTSRWSRRLRRRSSIQISV
jgi:ribosome recycling factor